MENWILSQNKYENNSFYTNIFSLGNGYMGVQAFDEETVAPFKYELCTYVAGIFEYFSPKKTDMVNTPNYWKTTIDVGGERFSLNRGKIISYDKQLNMKQGNLKRSVLWQNDRGEETLIETTRFLSLADVHCAAMKMSITPLNYSGTIRFETGIDADVKNNIVDDDQMKKDDNIISFLEKVSTNLTSDGIQTISLRTRESKMQVCEGFAVAFLKNGEPAPAEVEYTQDAKYVGAELIINAEAGNKYSIVKYISVWTSRDTNTEKLVPRVRESVSDMKKQGFNCILSQHINAWKNKWEISDICIEGDEIIQKSIRYNIFQLIQTNSESDPQVNIGARGIMHGRYKGCYFWDTDIFMFPFYLYTNPKAAKNLLMYRYHTLEGAKENARRQNLEGARYPWMSAIDGLDQCDTWDIGLSEVHITADVAYAINQYFEATSDIEFIRDYGLEILIETARYWNSRFSFNEMTGKYSLLFVKGPNEYGGVINNNLYTVMLAANNLQKAIDFIGIVKRNYPNEFLVLKNKIAFEEDEIVKWKEIINNPVINYDAKRSLYLEDDNILNLEPLELSAVKEGEQPLYKKLCFDRLQRYRVLKQADVILLMLLLPQKFNEVEKRSAWDYYEPITTHDSSLSYGTHAEFAAKLNLIEEAYKYFSKSVSLDLENVMGNSSIEGIHFAALGSSWQAIVKGFAGVELTDGKLNINPPITTKWKELKVKLFYKQCLLAISVSHKTLNVAYLEGEAESIQIWVLSKPVEIQKGTQILSDIN